MFCIKSSQLALRIVRTGLSFGLLCLLSAGCTFAQENAASGTHDDAAASNEDVQQLKALVQKLQDRIAALEDVKASSAHPSETAPSSSANAVVQNDQSQKLNAESVGQQAAAANPSAPSDFNILRGTTINFLLDGYYGYNFNNPIGRVNLLRAYDVSSNAFGLSQADLVLENAPDPDHGKRFGLRMDLQFGQATATLQGNAANEPRPEIYRNIFQAYGTYVAPVGKGLTIDFGKWASSLGIEGNYSKDQMNYSRSYYFEFLPFYHMGARLNYKVSSLFSLNYWITNGTQQTEPFNGFKDQLVGLALQPSSKVSWTLNYYLGQEHPDFQYLPGSTQPNLPVQQGIPFEPIVNAPKGKLHIFDSYVTWNVTPKLTLAGEGDYVIERLLTTSAPSHTTGGALYARYQITPRTAIAARSEYLSDHGGLFKIGRASCRERV